MQVSVENTGGLERRMHVRVDPEPFEEAFGRRLRETARTVRLNGFRPGKIPLKEVRRRFGTSIRAEVAVQLMQSSFHDALHQESLHPAGAPTFDPGDLEATDGFQFTATFEVLPDIQLGDLSGVRVNRPEAEVTDADVDAMVDRLRKGRTTWSAVERPASRGTASPRTSHSAAKGTSAMKACPSWPGTSSSSRTSRTRPWAWPLARRNASPPRFPKPWRTRTCAAARRSST